MIPPRARLPLLLGVVLLAWLQAVQACFYSDDQMLILSNPIVLQGQVLAAFVHHLWSGTGVEGALYHRPFVLVSFILDHAWFGLRPAGWHLDSLLWHLAAVGLVYALARPHVAQGPALLAAGIFGLHPAQSEAVVWISARNDLMCAAGIYACLAALDRGLLVVGALGALLAVGSKEIAYLLPLLWVAWRLAWGGRPGVREGAAIVLPLLAMGALRLLAQVGTPALAPARSLGVLDVLWRTVVISTSWLTVPWPLTSRVSVHLTPTSLQMAGALVFAAGLAWLWTVSPRSRGLLVAALICWAPSLLATWSTGNLGERFLYAPLGFLAIALVSAIPTTRRVYAGAALAGIVSTTVIAYRLSDWSDARWLDEVADARLPSSLTRLRMAQIHEGAGDPNAAIDAYRDAMRSDVPHLAACGQSARLLLDAGRVDEAVADVAAELAKCAGRDGYERERRRVAGAAEGEPAPTRSSGPLDGARPTPSSALPEPTPAPPAAR